MTLRDTQESALPTSQKPEFSAAEIGALAHLYRGEVYRSTAWRTRLDSTTNWAVVTTGIALSTSFSSARSEEHTSELQSRLHLVCRLLLEKKKQPLPTLLPKKSKKRQK